MSSAFLSASVIENFKWADNLFSLKLAVELKPFKAGQFVRLRLEVGGELIAKPYSLVNAPDEKYAEVLYNIVSNGVMSNALSKLKHGDIIEISQPAVGFFVIDEIPDCKNLWMMATGTGLGPYLSILQTPALWQRFEHVTLVHAVSHENNLAYKELINTLKNKYSKQFRYTPIVSRENIPNVLRGRIPELLQTGALESKVATVISPDDSHVMLCGNQLMIADVRTVLAERGMTKHLRRRPGHITAEHYF